jgi:hypothetical protein
MGYIAVTLSVPDPRLFIRDHNRAIRTANEEAAAYHHKEHMPDHFKMVGYSKYKLDKRTAAYAKRKHRKYNHALPNVLTGNTRREMLQNRTIRATPKGARLTMKIPLVGGSGQFRLRRGMKLRSIRGQVEMTRRIAELEAISQTEINTLATFRRDKYVDLVTKHIASGGRIRKRSKG